MTHLIAGTEWSRQSVQHALECETCKTWRLQAIEWLIRKELSADTPET